MTIEELKRLKPLDITKLDKSQWEDANAVLGVDSNDDVVMATPEDFAKESEIQEIISDINDIRTSITSGDTETLESAKAYTDDKLGDYYTKNEVEEKIDEATSGITVDAYTKAEADARFQPIGDYATEAYVTAATADFVTSGDVATQVSDFTYSKAVIDEKVAGGGSFDPTQYYTKTEVDNEISTATQDLVTSGEVESQITSKGYATTGYVDNAISSATENLASEAYVDNAVTAATDDMATQTWVGQQGYLTQHQSLAGLAASVFYDSTAHTIYFYDKDGTPLATSVDTTDFVKDGMIDNVEIVNGYLVITFNTDSGKETISIPLTDIFDPSNYYTKTEVDNAITAATDDMATQSWVQSQGYLTQHQDISGKLDTSVFTGYTASTETVLEGKADISDIPDVSGFVTSGDVETQITSKGYATENYVDGAISSATADFVTSGDVETQITSKGYITEAALSGYATEAYVTAATQDFVTSGDVESQITGKGYATTGDVESAVSGLASESYVDAAVTAATDDMATQTWVNNQGFLTQHQDISGKLDTSVFTGYTASTETVLESKANVTDIPDVSSFVTSGEVETQITNKGYATTGDVASAVSGLASENYVDSAITAATVDFVTSGDVETQITSKGYATTGDVETAVSGLASESYVTNAITAATADFVTSGDVATQVSDFTYSKAVIDEKVAGGGSFDPTQYYTKTEVDNEISAATQDLASESYVTNAITAATVDMATTGYVASAVSGLASESYVDAAVTAATDDMATQTWVNNQGFLTQHQDISGKLDTTVFTGYTASTETVLESKANVSDIPDVSDFVTSGDVETQITNKGYATTGDVETAVSGLASESYVTNAITAATADFVTSGDVETQITGKGYITESALNGYATEAYVTAATEDMATTGDVATAVSGLASESYVTNAVTAATDDMATQTWVQSQGYLTQHQDISGKLDTTVFTGYTAATEETLNSKADVVYMTVTTGSTSSWKIGLNYAYNTNVSNLIVQYIEVYTAGNNLSISDQNGKWLYNENINWKDKTTLTQGWLYAKVNHSGPFYVFIWTDTKEIFVTDSLEVPDEFATKVYVDNAVSGLASEAYVTAATADFVTSGDVETQITSKNYATTGYVDSAVSGLASENYVDSAITAATADMATTGDVATKQDTLVSGTNIKTINGNSILGSGNLVIQGGGGTGGTEYYAGTNINIDSDNYINVTGITSQVNTYWVDGGSSQYVESGTGYDLYTTYVESSGHDVMSENTDVRIFSNRIYGQSTNQSYYLQQHDVDQWYGITNTGSCIELDTVYDIVDAGTDSSSLTNPIVVSGFTDYFDVYYCFDMVNMKFWASKTIKYSVTGPQSLVYGTMPYAQDGSPKKGYIYDAGQYGKRVVSRAEILAVQQNGKLGVQNSLYFWGNSSSSEGTNTVFLPTATASADGVMPAGDKSRFNDINSGLAITSAYTIGSSTSGDTDEYYFEINSTNYYFNKTNVSGVYVLSYTPSSTDTWFYVHSNEDDGQGSTLMKMWQWSDTWITDASSFPIEKSLSEQWSGSYINFGSFASQMYFIWDTNNNVMMFQTNLNYVAGYKTIATTDYVDGIVGNIESILQTI